MPDPSGDDVLATEGKVESREGQRERGCKLAKLIANRMRSVPLRCSTNL